MPLSRQLRANWTSRIVLGLLALWLGLAAPAATSGQQPRTSEHPRVAHGRRAALATVHPLATQAGLDQLKNGGNAVDAAVAAALMLAVVDGHNSGIGGGCFVLIRRSNGELLAIDGRETAPALASPDMFLRDGQPDTELSQIGPLAAGVPGALAAYALAVEKAGTVPLARLLEPAAERAEAGFELDAVYADALAETADELRQFPDSRRIFLDAQGQPLPQGHRLIQTDLAKTYRQIARHGVRWFYQGPFAEALDGWMRANGGLLRAQDLAQYQPKLREPIVSTYRGYTIIGFPPPSSGGVHVAQILNILESFDVAELYRQRGDLGIHVIAQAMQLAFADRAYWLGDADFVPVPKGLVDKQYARQLAKRIQMERLLEVQGHGTPNDWQERLFSRHTTHVAAADAEGNWVAITTTVNTTFGSKVVVPGTGVILNNQMDDFSIAPGEPNAFGLVGGQNNAVAPGKRPLSSMSPTIVLRDGEPIFTVGAAGGPTIISQVVLAIVHRIDLGMDLDQALSAPRFHHQWRPDQLVVERSLDDSATGRLEALGYRIRATERMGVTQAVGRMADGLTAVSDPRVPGMAAAW